MNKICHLTLKLGLQHTFTHYLISGVVRLVRGGLIHVVPERNHDFNNENLFHFGLGQKCNIKVHS